MADKPEQRHPDDTGGNGRDSKGRFIAGNAGAWQPGQSGNPGGMVPGKSITAALNDMLKDGLEVTDKNGLVKRVDLPKALAEAAYQAALKGDHRFLNTVLERTEGRVSEEIHITTGLTMVLHPSEPPADWYDRVAGLIGTEKGDPPIRRMTGDDGQ